MLAPMQNVITALKDNIGIWYVLLINFIGVLAIVVKVCELQLKKRDGIIKFYIINGALWVIYFLLNADLVSGLTCFFGVIQGVIFIQRGKKKWASSIWWLFGFILVQIACFVIFYNNWHDIFSAMAGVFAVIAYFMLKEKNYRLFIFLSLLAWVLNSVFKLYYIAILHDSLGLISAVVAIIRYDFVKNKTKLDNV